MKILNMEHSLRNPIASPVPFRNIMIVDDHRELRESMAEWINEMFPEMIIHLAGTGEAGVEMAVSHHPGIILMDLDLPGMNVFETMRTIRNLGIESRFIVITGHMDEIYRQTSLSSGASAFITKNKLGKQLPSILRCMLEGESFNHDK